MGLVIFWKKTPKPYAILRARNTRRLERSEGTMNLSTRILGLKPSPTVAMNVAAKALAAKGVKVVNLSVGETDFNTPEPIVEKAIAALKNHKTRYGAPGGGEALRKAIALKMKRDNQLDYATKEIVAGVGAKEILFHAFMSILNEGDEVLLPTPYWVSYTAHCEAFGAVPVALSLPKDLQKGPFLTPAMLEEKATSKTKILVLNSPNNPAGYVLSKADLMELGNYLKNKSWWIISDEIYEYLSFDTPQYSLLTLFPELRERFIVVNGFSKAFAMTGWRVGYACGPRSVISLIENLQSQSSTCLPGFIEDACVYAVEHGAPLMAKEIATLKKRRDLVVAELKKIPHLSFMQPSGAFYVFLNLTETLARSKKYKDSLSFGQYLLETHHVAMVPGEAFGAPGFLRMSYAADDATLLEGISRFKTALMQAVGE
jgi:aspartate aminotransferase